MQLLQNAGVESGAGGCAAPTRRFSRDTRRTLPPCSTLLVEFTISCLVLYCRYTVFPRTWACMGADVIRGQRDLNILWPHLSWTIKAI